MKDPTPQALKAARAVVGSFRSSPCSTFGFAYIIDRETKLPELLEVAQMARELCKVLYLDSLKTSLFEKETGNLNDALGRLDA